MSGSKVSTAKLTSLYVVLHKIVVCNWATSKNNYVVTYKQGSLIYKIGKGLPLNFGKVVFDIVCQFAKLIHKRTGLPFSSLIYQVLSFQGLEPSKKEKLTTIPPLIGIFRTLLPTGTRKIMDLPFVEEQALQSYSSDSDCIKHTFSTLFANLNDDIWLSTEWSVELTCKCMRCCRVVVNQCCISQGKFRGIIILGCWTQCNN